MPSLWPCNNSCDIIGENKLLVIVTVKNEHKFMLRMLPGDPLKRLEAEPADSLKLVPEQQPRINCNFQVLKIGIERSVNLIITRSVFNIKPAQM